MYKGKIYKIPFTTYTVDHYSTFTYNFVPLHL